jgi:hypothetical protein
MVEQNVVVGDPAKLHWDEHTGTGHYPAKPNGVYDDAYFHKYAGYAETDLGCELLAARLALIARHVPASAWLVDVGIGSGTLIGARPRTLGYDVNPAALKWMKERNVYIDLDDRMSIHSATFFDSLEHLEHPIDLVAKISNVAIVSIPIFYGRSHALLSRHFRPDEHYWYFTAHGLIRWFLLAGFELREANRMESEIGREDIGTFVFRRFGA